MIAAVGEDNETVELTVPEAKMIFQSMKDALDTKQRNQIEIGGFVWMTDCRVHPDDPERVAMSFKSANTSTQAVLRRADLAGTLLEFKQKLFAAL